MNCRSVSPKTWEYARQALVFYFTRRHGLPNAEDLAHETLATILSREDYHFEKEEDFLKVCYGFAFHISQNARRDSRKHITTSMEPTAPLPHLGAQGLKDAEVKVYLNEVLRLGSEDLRTADWQLIQQSMLLDADHVASDPTTANSVRVKLHRARKRLAHLAGWRKG